MLRRPATKLELAEKPQAVPCGGLAFVRQIGLADRINQKCPIFKIHQPYTEADHVLNIAFNLFAGGSCLEHLEMRRERRILFEAARGTADPGSHNSRRFLPTLFTAGCRSINGGDQ